MPRRYPTSRQSLGWLPELVRNARLAWRLLRDPRVSPWVKLALPGVLLVYLLLPLDAIPDLFPVLGQVDDLMVLLLAGWLFIRLAPGWIVEEHQQAMEGGAVRPSPGPAPQEAEGGVVIEGRYRVVDPGDGGLEGGTS